MKNNDEENEEWMRESRARWRRREGEERRRKGKEGEKER